MPLPQFQWHPDAHAYAGAEKVMPQTGTVPRHIPAKPIVSALSSLGRVFSSGTPFCISDYEHPCLEALEALDAAQFATLTGGTSGTPKIIARSQVSWLRSFDANAAQFQYSANDSIAVLGALSHSLALYGVLEALHLGLNAHVLSALYPAGQVAQMRLHGCTILYATPSQLRLLRPDAPLGDLRLILCGGGTLNAATREHIASFCPNAALHVFYGAAETSFVTLSDATTPATSVGKPYPDVQIQVRDLDETGIGTIWINSPYLFDGYLQGDSKHTSRDGAWLTVGEQGMMDEQGNLFLLGRAGRSVNIADQTIHLDQLEAEMNAVPYIPQCVLLARPDQMRGHHVIAVVDGAASTTIRDKILDHCKAENLHIPRDVVFLDPLPQLPSGKPDMRRIADLTGATP
ncbi:MAG: AMP-binding protein [Sulfitobacter sp.]